MRITIKYESCWQNSFLGGSNNDPLPKNGRGFVGSMTNLSKRNAEGKYTNFIKQEIKHDTVMGVLNRLIGDQRKLYQARESPSYFFKDIEDKVTFQIHQSKIINNMEMVYIRNMTGSTDQNSYTGMIKSSDPVFNSAYSDAFWGVLTLRLDELCRFILMPNFIVDSRSKFDPISVLERLEQLKKLRPVEVVDDVQAAVEALQKQFPDVDYKIIDGKIKPIEIYCSALYLQVARLSQSFDLSNVLTKNNGISGVSKRGFTPKDFMDRFTTGDKKPIWGNPYLLKEKRQGEGEIVFTLTKSSGVLDIELDVTQERAIHIENMIEAAGVSSFYLGKKGLAYVEKIRV